MKQLFFFSLSLFPRFVSRYPLFHSSAGSSSSGTTCSWFAVTGHTSLSSASICFLSLCSFSSSSLSLHPKLVEVVCCPCRIWFCWYNTITATTNCTWYWRHCRDGAVVGAILLVGWGLFLCNSYVISTDVDVCVLLISAGHRCKCESEWLTGDLVHWVSPDDPVQWLLW